MKFITNTKPLSDSLDLGVINANISNFHKKSTIAQITATKDTLRINLEASMLCSEIVLKGSGDEDVKKSIFVGSLLLKQLVSTLESPTVTLEFADGGLIIHSGKSKFTLPKMVDEDELDLRAPEIPEYSAPEIDVDKSDWKFIKDNQMFAIAMSFIHPVYTKVWIGESGDVIVGDFDNSLFTHSKRGKLGKTCLLSDTIVNLFTSIPEGSKIVQLDRDYLIRYSSDSFSYVSQFTPLYEDDENVGSYNSEIFLNMMVHPDKYVTAEAPVISKFLNQADMLSSTSEDVIKFEVSDGVISLKDSNVDCKLDVKGVCDNFGLEFKSESLRRVMTNYDDSSVNIAPMVSEGEVAGILVWDDNLTTLVAGVE